MNDDQLLPKTIEMRALAHMEKGIEPIEAVKLAFEEEENTIWMAMEGIDMKTGRIYPEVKKAIQDNLCDNVYTRLRNEKH